jgi:hypothetical protein
VKPRCLDTAERLPRDGNAWAILYSTVSRPFAPPTTGKIAVKAISCRGDEVLEVYDVAQGRQRGIPGVATDGLCTLWRLRRWSIMVGRQAADLLLSTGTDPGD